MARRFSWCTVVALVVLLFVTTEGLRERGTQVDDHKAHSTKDRGTLRYNFKSPEETSTSASSLSRARSRNRTSHLERHNGSISKPSINSEAKVESNRRSNFRTARTTERNVVSAATETTNTPQKTLERDSENIKKIEPAIHRKNDHRHPSEHNKPPKPKVDEQSSTLVTPTEASRRSSNRKSDNPGVTKRLDDIGPSFFTATTEFSRSRTGRKVQTSYTTSELKTQLPTSRKFNNKKFEGIETTTAAFKRTESRGRSTTERSDRGRSGRSKVTNRENNTISRRIDGPDPLLSESESIRVDVPLTVEATESLIVNTTTESIVRSQRQSIDTNRRSDTKDSSKANTRPGSERFKIRGRANDTESASPAFRNSSRRGSSKFNDYATTEASEANSRRNTVSRDRSRISESNKSSTNEVRPRSRGRNLENSGKSSSIVASERDVKRKLPGDRNTSERRSRVLDLGARPAENRGQDQDTRGRSRSRSRLDATTAAVSVDTITTAAPDTTVSNEITTSSTEASTEVTSTTIRPTSPATTTTSSRTLTTTARPTINTAASEGSGRNRGRGRGGGNQGRKQAKEDFFNHGLGFRGRRPSPEGSPNVEDSKKPTASKNDSQNQGNPGWTLRRRPSHLNHSETLAKIVPSPKDQTNEVIPPNEQLTSTEIISTIESSTTTTRRGFKKQQSSTEESTIVNGTTKSFRRGNKTFEKNRTFGIGKGSTEPDESDNYPPDFKARLTQLVKKSSAALFAERSRMKLELARRLVKPELNIEENDLDATTASSFSKSKSTGASAVDETSKVAKFENPGAAERRSSTEASQDDDKASKLSKLEKSLEDSSKLRPSVLRKGRIVSERMVTSISVEERPEETTKSYASTNPSVSTVFAEEGSATTVDSTKVRLAALRGGKKSKEDDKASVRENDSVTTFKPKKPYVHRSRNSKSQDQSSTAEQTSVSTLKKSYSSSNKQNIGQRKSLSSQEEDVTKKPRFTESDTKSTFRPRYSKRTKVKSVDGTEEQTLTTKVPLATSRYSRKKSIIKSTEGKVKITTTEGPATPTRKQEFRPRTATYRRHSEVPTTLVESTTKTESTGVAITPRVPRYHATLKSSTQSSRSVPQEPQVNLNIVNDTAQQAPGITGGSNGDIGNSNIFNPTRSAFLSGNDTLLEQLRSTVAPLLSSLGNKTPVFSGSYSNVNNANSAPRITPSGSPPRFSARYKGAELFVRKQNNIYQPTVPSITSSSTTPVTPVESNTPMNAQTGTTSNVMSAIAGRPPTDSQGSRIVQDRERDEATRTKEAGGQRSSVYIGQDKFVNYWTNGDPATNQRVVSVNISSVASAANEGPSPSVPSFENLLNSQPGGRVTAPPGFPWRDPLDQIFGITTSSPVITASVASNTLDDSGDTNSPVFARPVNPFVEVFTPFSSAIGNIKNGAVPSTQSTSTTAATTVTPATTTTTTTAQTTTTTMAPTTTTTTTTTVAPTTTTVASTTTSAPATTTAGTTVNTPPPVTSLNLPANLLTNMQQQNAFGTTFDDLAFLNSLLQTNSRQATPKTLTEVEQLLANKILSLALNNPGPTRSPKAINIENASPNSIYYSSPKSVDPVVIDLSPSSTAATPTWKPVPTEQTTEKPISTTTTKPIVSSPPTTTTTKTSLISTTKAPVAITVKTTPRPRTTTPPSLGFGASLWQALFGNGLFAPPTTQRPLKPKQVKTTPKSVNITPKPVPITQKPETTTLRTVDVSKIQVSTPNSIVKDAKPASTSNSISTTKQPLLNNPNPRLSNAATSTFSPEEDAKFLLALLQAADEENKTSGSKKSSGLTQDDESFLRAILSGRALTTTTTPAPSNDISNAALLAALLKAQGIEPPTPATNIREQLLLASLGQSVSSAPTASPATESTTITTRPPSTATRPTVTTKKPVTPRPTSGPRIRTTTWSPSSTYPPPLFSSFSNYGTPVQSSSGDNSGGGALLGATRAFSQFLGAAISGAAKQLQSLVRNSTRIMSGVVGQN
ncbi:uncharacterized protein LOC143180714 isoform X4 [Calliopsis andreniformis]|uniref:uncharacterized protein LOC143180714 isoform X4 n=1 Tax=Calliopsis andreniformis TaxID=337506 RepID=UPI003FCE8531